LADEGEILAAPGRPRVTGRERGIATEPATERIGWSIGAEHPDRRLRDGREPVGQVAEAFGAP
jgi:hypothetical protein